MCMKYFAAMLSFLFPPQTRRAKGGDRSPVLVPPSRLPQHHLNELGPLWLSKYPVVVAVAPRLNLINVGGKEAIQGVTGHNDNIIRKPHRTTIKIRLELMILFNCPWFSRG